MLTNIFSQDNRFQKLMIGYADYLEKAAKEFSTFMVAFDPAKIADWSKRMKDIEHGADNVTHETMNWLQSSFIVNYDREDIHELASDLDDIIDMMDAASTRISLYGIKEILPAVVQLSNQLSLACFSTAKAIRAVSTTSKPDKSILEICKEIKKYEEEGDRIYHDTLALLFRDSKDALFVIKWKEIIEDIELALDKCNESANDVEGIVLKYS